MERAFSRFFPLFLKCVHSCQEEKVRAGSCLLSDVTVSFFTTFLFHSANTSSIMSATRFIMKNALHEISVVNRSSVSQVDKREEALLNLYKACFSVSFERICVFREISDAHLQVCRKALKRGNRTQFIQTCSGKNQVLPRGLCWGRSRGREGEISSWGGGVLK